MNHCVLAGVLCFRCIRVYLALSLVHRGEPGWSRGFVLFLLSERVERLPLAEQDLLSLLRGFLHGFACKLALADRLNDRLRLLLKVIHRVMGVSVVEGRQLMV